MQHARRREHQCEGLLGACRAVDPLGGGPDPPVIHHRDELLDAGERELDPPGRRAMQRRGKSLGVDRIGPDEPVGRRRLTHHATAGDDRLPEG